MKNFNVILFNDFETLDVFGPVEIIGQVPELYCIKYYSLHGGNVVSKQNLEVDTLPFSKIDSGGYLLIPGGMGTRVLVNDDCFIEEIKRLTYGALKVLTVCTGSAILAKTGLLDNKKATSNKVAFDWVCSLNNKVEWIKHARWVVDGNIYTSSGVSAGMDMTLGFISDLHNEKVAKEIADYIEYIWNQDSSFDPFA